jgi:nucleoside-diphosphate-sugar epimerase
MPVELRDQRILLTGPTSQVGLPIARALAPHNEVHGVARFRDPATRAPLEAIGVECIALDLAEGSFAALSEQYDYVLNFAVVKSGDFAYDLCANAEGAGRLLAHCRDAKGFLHCSSAAVYAEDGPKPFREDAPLGDNHRMLFPTYSISKIAAETTVRFAAREFGVPTSIARFSVPYGENGGWPWFHLMMIKAGSPIAVSPDAPNLYNPIFEDDYIAHLPRLFEVATPETTTLNWGGSEAVAIEEWCAWLGELTGLEPQFETREGVLAPLPICTEKMDRLIGPTRVDWRSGIRRLVKARNPELLKPEYA